MSKLENRFGTARDAVSRFTSGLEQLETVTTRSLRAIVDQRGNVANAILNRANIQGQVAQINGQQVPLGLGNRSTLDAVRALTGTSSVSKLSERLKTATGQFRQTRDPNALVAIDNAKRGLTLLADAGRRTADILSQINQVEQQRLGRRGFFEQFIAADARGRGQLLRDVAAGQQFRQNGVVVNERQQLRGLRLLEGAGIDIGKAREQLINRVVGRNVFRDLEQKQTVLRKGAGLIGTDAGRAAGAIERHIPLGERLDR